jgi:lipopolysaccharide transport system ATP-binding protein
MKEAALIKVEGVSKKFCLDLKTSLRYGVMDVKDELLGRPRTSKLRKKEFWAVHDVSFELHRGECLGLIGHNGAGKTTLLRMLNGLIKPDFGRIEIRGQVGALIALGAGFNPILTGRENVYVNASVLGLSKSVVDERIDEIIAFAELEEFIDMPVQNYSSGMTVRLGFAVASILIQPDILFLDEVLAVGDITFTIKCLNRVRELMRTSAVVFVSHSMPLISSFCTRVMVMDHGRTVLDTLEPGEGVNHYYGLVRNDQQVSGSGDAQILSALMTVDGMPVHEVDPTLPQGADMVITVTVRVTQARKAHVTVLVDDASLAPLLGVPVVDERGEFIELGPGDHTLRVPMGRMDLNVGKYAVLVTVRDAVDNTNLCRHQGLLPFRVHAERVYWAKFIRMNASERLSGPIVEPQNQPLHGESGAQ